MKRKTIIFLDENKIIMDVLENKKIVFMKKKMVCECVGYVYYC